MVTPPAAKPTQSQRLASLTAKVQAALPKQAQAPAAESAAEVSAGGTQKPEASPPAAGDKPTPKDAAAHARTLSELAKAQGQLAELQKQLTEAKAGGDLTKGEHAKLQGVIDKAKLALKEGGDPDALHDFLELAGLSPPDIAKAMADQKLKAREARAKLDPAVQAQLDRLATLEKERADREAAAAKEQETAKQTKAREEAEAADLADVTTLLEQHAEEVSPLFAAFPDAAQRALNVLYARMEAAKGEPVDAKAVFADIEKAVMGEVATVLKNPRALKALRANPEFRAIFAAEQTAVPAPKSATSRPGKQHAGQTIPEEGPSEIPARVATETKAEGKKKLTKGELEAEVSRIMAGGVG